MKIDLFVRMQMRCQGILKSNQNGILKYKKKSVQSIPLINCMQKVIINGLLLCDQSTTNNNEIDTR